MEEDEELTLEERWRAIDEVDENYLKFEEIPEDQRLHPDHKLCGYLKIYSLLKDKEKPV